MSEGGESKLKYNLGAARHSLGVKMTEFNPTVFKKLSKQSEKSLRLVELWGYFNGHGFEWAVNCGPGRVPSLDENGKQHSKVIWVDG